VAGTLKQVLRYGENPHQTAALYLDGNKRPGAALATFLQGKELSYNNLNDTNAAFELVSEFEAPAVAIIKHANPCGVASGKDMLSAYKSALLCDPVSAFGGIIALNRPLDKATAEEITKIFVEVIIAPSVEPAALEVLKKKDKIRVLATGEMPKREGLPRIITRIAGGFPACRMPMARISQRKI
jgi:phosphoribosylaminoimidazolecarboxamide formyltransferase/IMP cyclohydrolase